jgi:hypothetical protein
MADDDQMRFSLRLALAITTVCAMLIAAVRVETWWAMRVSFTIMFAANLTAICLAIYRRGVRRAFWIGFAVFGWGYFLV